MILINICE